MKRTTKHAENTHGWLMARIPGGDRRIDRLSWKRLADIHAARTTTPATRKAIEKEARRCGYTPSTILRLNRSK